MPVEKIDEFAKNGQKSTDGIILENGFPQEQKPLRQWFNYLFNKQAVKTNQVIDEINRLDADVTDLSATKFDTGITVTSKSEGQVARSQASKNSDIVSVLDFGAIPDGITDCTIPFQKAYDYCESVGGGVIHVPYSGTGVYSVNSMVNGKAKTELRIDSGVTIDLTKQTGGSSGQAFRFSGSYIGDEIALAENVTRKDITITTVTPHNLEVGDWFLLKSQRNSLHADGGTDWRLGIPTGSADSHACYYGEPCRVNSVESPTVVKLQKGLIFPDYRKDAKLETSIRARPYSTIQKIDFMERPKVVGGVFKSNGTTVLRFTLCKEAEVRDSNADLGIGTGSFISNVTSLENRFDNVKAEHSSIYYIVADHSQYNSFKEISSWFTYYNYEDRNGAQGLDVTYAINGVTSIAPFITGSSYDSHEQGLTMHAGCYGFTIDSLRVIRAKQGAITLRSRYGQIKNPYVIGTNVNLLAGIQFTQWATDCLLDGGYIEGYHQGVSIGNTATVQPIIKNITISNLTICRVDTGIRLETASATSTPIKNSDLSGINISNVRIMQWDTYGIFIGEYVNYVSVQDVHVGTTSGVGDALHSSSNTVGHEIHNFTGGELPDGSRLLRLNGISDRVTFPIATYPNNRIHLSSIRNLNSQQVNVSMNESGYKNTQTGNYTFSARDEGTIVYSDSSTASTFTIPFDGSIFHVGAQITCIQLGTGLLSIAGSSAAVTLGSTSPLNTGGRYGKITLTKVGLSTWVLSK